MSQLVSLIQAYEPIFRCIQRVTSTSELRTRFFQAQKTSCVWWAFAGCSISCSMTPVKRGQVL